MTAPLVVVLPLVKGEALSGFVSRLARLYETTPRDICSDLGMRWPALCTGHHDQLNRLAWLIGLPQKMLRDHHIRKITYGRYQIGHAEGTTGVLRRTSGRLCPKCAVSALESQGAKGLFHLLEWSVTCVTTCFIHACPLIQLPRSGNSHASYDFASRVLEHKPMIMAAADSGATIPETSFEAYVRQRIRRGPSRDWLEQLDLTHLHRCCLSLGASLTGYRSVPFLTLPSEEAQMLCELGFKHLIKGPSGVCEALESSYHNDSSRRPYVSADMGPFYRWLHNCHTDPALSQLVEVTRKHIFETYPASPKKEVFGKRPPKQQLYTMADARIQTGLGATFLKRLLGHLNGQTDDVALTRTDVSADELRCVMDFWRSLAKLGEAASMLGVLPEQVKRLQNLGVLKTIKLASTLRYAERDQVLRILKKVDALPKAGATSSTVPLRSYCRSNRLPIEKLIAFWLREGYSDAFSRGDGCGVHKIMIDSEIEITRDDVLLDGDLTVMEAARFLKINVQSIRKLRDAGYLEEIQRRNPDTNHLRSYISKSSIQAFERTYITLGQMASRQQVASIHLARQLDRDCVQPISCGNEFVRVYDRNAVGWERIAKQQKHGGTASYEHGND